MKKIKCKKCGAENETLIADIKKLSFATYDVETKKLENIVDIEKLAILACPKCLHHIKTVVKEF